MIQHFVVKKINQANFGKLDDLKPDSREEFYGKAAILTGENAAFLTGKSKPVLNIGEYVLTRKDLLMVLQHMEMEI